MSHYSFHDEILSPLFFSFPFFSFLFSLKFYLGWLQEQRVDTQGKEMNGIGMHEVKDTKNK